MSLLSSISCIQTKTKLERKSPVISGEKNVEKAIRWSIKGEKDAHTKNFGRRIKSKQNRKENK